MPLDLFSKHFCNKYSIYYSLFTAQNGISLFWKQNSDKSRMVQSDQIELESQLRSRFIKYSEGVYLWLTPHEETRESIRICFEEYKRALERDRPKNHYLIVEARNCKPLSMKLTKFIKRGMESLPTRPEFAAISIGYGFMKSVFAKFVLSFGYRGPYRLYDSTSFALSDITRHLRGGYDKDNIDKLKSFFASNKFRYLLIGVVFGSLFPVFATIALMLENGVSFQEAQSNAGWLMHIINTAPLFLGAFALYAGVKQDRLSEFSETLSIDAYHMTAMVQNAGVAICTISIEKTILTWNRKCEELFGWKSHEAIGQSISLIFPTDDRAFENAVIEKSIKGEQFVVEAMGKKKDGSQTQIEQHFAPIRNIDHSFDRVSLHIFDISEKKALRDKLSHSSKLAAIGELAAGIGHEINNPLAITDGATVRLAKLIEKGEIDRAKLSSTVSMISTATERMRKIVLGLRSFSRIDRDESSRFDLAASTKESCDFMRPSLEALGIKFNYELNDLNIPIFGKSGEIQQIVVNLLANARDAVKTCQQRVITLSISTDQHKVYLRVADTGIGIPEDLKPNIFTAFFTTKNRNEGTGLGLSLSQAIAHRHHGKISYQSSESGTEFLLELPLNSETSQNEIKARDATSVLVVDDDAEITDILVDTLTQKGYCASGTTSAIDALQLIASGTIDVVVTDVVMPEMDGFTLIDRVYSSNLPNKPKFVVITGCMSDEEFSEKSKLREETLLSKPIAVNEMENAIIDSLKKIN